MNDKQWNLLFMNLEAAIITCLESSPCEKAQVECSFKVAIGFWEDIKRQLEGYIFESESSEIDFYKVIKPKFTSYIEYFTMVYQYLSFSPEENPDAKLGYLQNEVKRLSRFMDKHKGFIKYYKSGSSDMDLQYFLPANYDLAGVFVSRIYDNDGAFVTSHDPLVAVLLAHEMYHAFIIKKLESVTIKN